MAGCLLNTVAVVLLAFDFTGCNIIPCGLVLFETEMEDCECSLNGGGLPIVDDVLKIGPVAMSVFGFTVAVGTATFSAQSRKGELRSLVFTGLGVVEVEAVFIAWLICGAGGVCVVTGLLL